jgi:hypothetical protein
MSLYTSTRAAGTALLFLAALNAAIAGDNPRTVRALRAGSPPKIDGVLDEPEWRAAVPAADFIQLDPEEGKPGSERSEVRVLYDDEAIYFGCTFYDSRPDLIVSPFTRRDNQVESDWGSIEIDSYHDFQNCYEFSFNPSGVKVDILRFDDGNNEDASWDPVWYIESQITPQGWTAELKIPFSMLRYNSPGSDTGEYAWGINFMRNISRKQEDQMWAFTPKKESGFVSRFGRLVGLNGLPDPQQLEVVPFTVSKQTFTPASDVMPKVDQFTQEFGADFKYGLSKNFTLDATINPDFGQVEADPAVLNLSTLETFYPEKRPFFIEGTQFIRFTTFGGQFGPGMFYSRRIGRGISPDEVSVPAGGRIESIPQSTRLMGAAKVNGKTGGGLAVGVLEAFTDEERAVVSDSNGARTDQVVEPFGQYNIIRLKQDVLANSYVGAIFTSVAKHSRLPAFSNGYDWKLRLDRNTFALDGFLALSHTTLSGGERKTGSAGKLSFSRIAAEHWLWSAQTDFTSPKYNINDAGFFFSPDDYGGSGSLTYKEDVPQVVVRSYRISGGAHLRQNFEGVNLFRQFSANGDLLFSNYWNSDWSAEYDFGGYDQRETRGNGLYRKPHTAQTSLTVGSDGRNSVVGELTGRYAWDELSMGQAAVELGLEMKPLPWMRWGVSTLYEVTRNQEAWVMNRTDGSVFGDRSTDAWDFTLRGMLAFTNELTLEYYGQLFLAKGKYENYRLLSGDASFTPVPETPELRAADFNDQSFNSNLVLRWEYLPGSTIFLVWSQARSDGNGDYNTTMKENIGETFRIAPANVLLLKITYWWNV